MAVLAAGPEMDKVSAATLSRSDRRLSSWVARAVEVSACNDAPPEEALAERLIRGGWKLHLCPGGPRSTSPPDSGPRQVLRGELMPTEKSTAWASANCTIMCYVVSWSWRVMVLAALFVVVAGCSAAPGTSPERWPVVTADDLRGAARPLFSGDERSETILTGSAAFGPDGYTLSLMVPDQGISEALIKDVDRRDVVVAVDVVPPPGAKAAWAGVTCRADGRGTQVSSYDGFVVGADGTAAIIEVDGSGLRVLATGTYPPTAGLVHVEARCVGQKLALLAGGLPIVAVAATPSAGHNVGVTIEAPAGRLPGSARFTALEIRGR